MKDKSINSQGDININPSGLPQVSKLITAENVRDGIKIVKKVSFDLETTPLTSDYLYTHKHNLGVAYDFYGRYKKSYQTKWTTIPNVTQVTAGGLIGGVDLHSITENDITFWIDFAFEFPTVNFEIFFIEFKVD